MSVIGSVLLVLSILNFTELRNQKFFSTFSVLGLPILIIGLSQISAARSSRKTAAKFVKCLDCGTINKNGSMLCEKCGKPIRMFCPHCGVQLDGGSSFCNACGHNLQIDID